MEFVKYEETEKLTQFIILVTGAIRTLSGAQEELVFQIRDRYSGLLEFQKIFRADVGYSSPLPEFPEKKTFGKDKNFLQQRMTQLQAFFDALLASPQSWTDKASKIFEGYFTNTLISKGDALKIQKVRQD